MKTYTFSAALVLSCAASAPASAADLQTLPCIERAAGPDLSNRIGQAAASEMIADSQAAPAATSDADFELLAEKLIACATQHGWSEAASEAALSHAIARMSLPALEILARKEGVDPERIKRAFAGLPVSYRSGFSADGEPFDEAVEALLRGAMAEGVSSPGEEQGSYIGMLAALYSTLEVQKDAFVRN